MLPINFGELGHEEEGASLDVSGPTESSAADPDIIPRGLTLTMIAGSILGIVFWFAMTVLLVRYI